MEALATKYRPKKFQDVVAQTYVRDILLNQLEMKEYKNGYLFTGSAGTGKAQPLSSKILTKDGFIEMRDAKVGTKVLDGKGNETVITGVFPQGKRDIYKIYFNDRTFIEVSDEHLNSVYRYNQHKKCDEEFVWTTKQLQEYVNSKHLYSMRVRIPILDSWEEKTLPIHPYLLGALLGDGSLSNNFGFSNSERDVIDKVNSLLNELNYELRPVKNTKVDYAICRNDGKVFNQFSNMSDSLHHLLDSYELLVKSIDKHIPRDYLYNSLNVRQLLLQGLIDTDGYIDSSGNVIYTTSSKNLSNDFMFLARSLGIRVTLKVEEAYYTNKDGKKIKCNNSFSHYLKIPSCIKFYSSNKHKSRYKPRQNEPIRKITKVEFDRVEECQCIMVESDEHTYITENLTVTHNTTSARIFANEVNKGKGTPIEIDAASNNSVANIRSVIDDSKFRSMDSEFKFYIIDECHMLSTGAWNALLKTLEEPPAGTIFILCTTDPQKIPATILSRVQRFDFSRIDVNDIVNRLIAIIESENANGYEYTYTNEGLEFIAKLANGGMRDAISRLEKVLDYSNDVTVENVGNALGAPDYETFLNLLQAIASNESADSLAIIDSIYMSGRDLKLAMRNFTDFVVDICRYILTNTLDNTQIPLHLETAVQEAVTQLDYPLVLWMLEELNELNSVIKWEPNPKPIVDLQILLMTKDDLEDE